MNKLRENWNHLKRVNLEDLVVAKPRILIGMDNWDLLLTSDVIRGPKNGPAVSRTKLGWVLHGNVAEVQHRVETVFNIWGEEEDSLHQLVKKSFATEDFGVKLLDKLPHSKDEEKAIAIMEKTTRRVENKWETGLLWKEESMKLPESKSMALRRLWSVEKKMDKDQSFADQYIKKIEDYISKGYARKLDSKEAEVEGDKTWYLPHFAVINPNKPGKIRIVFDAAARSHGVSLNDSLLKGPDLMCPLVGVLCKFRERRVAVGGDIEEMFSRVGIRQQDQSSQRFLWRGANRDHPPEVYEMLSMFFGAIDSPSKAQYVKNVNAEEFSEEFIRAVVAIIEKHYVDDYLDSFDTEEETIKVIHDVMEVHRQGGFRIRNWISNSKEVLSSLPRDVVANCDKDLDLESE